MIGTPPNRLSAGTLTLSVGLHVAMPFENNQYTTDNTSAEERGMFFDRFVKILRESPYSGDRLRFIGLKRGTAVHSGYSGFEYPPVYTPSEASDHIRAGNTGVALFWGDPAAGTERLCCVDLDSPDGPDLYDQLPETLEVVSGSGDRHLIYHNDGSVRHYPSGTRSMVNARPTGKRLTESYTVAPGSIHNTTIGVYHVREPSEPIATLSDSDLPSALRSDQN